MYQNNVGSDQKSSSSHQNINILVGSKLPNWDETCMPRKLHFILGPTSCLLNLNLDNFSKF